MTFGVYNYPKMKFVFQVFIHAYRMRKVELVLILIFLKQTDIYVTCHFERNITNENFYFYFIFY